jgi:hypothetical protein
MERVLAGAELAAEVLGIRESALRLELQPWYGEPEEADAVQSFAAGGRPDPTEIESLRDWYTKVHELTDAGMRVERVRVVDDPPTASQLWEQWSGRWNVVAGEVIRYLPRGRACDAGIPAADGAPDWWLLDGERLIRLHFDDRGNRVRTVLTDDPSAVDQARSWWDLAVTLGAPDRRGDSVTATP